MTVTQMVAELENELARAKGEIQHLQQLSEDRLQSMYRIDATRASLHEENRVLRQRIRDMAAKVNALAA